MDRRTFITFALSVLTGGTVRLPAMDHDRDNHGRNHGRVKGNGAEGQQEHGHGRRDSYFRSADELYLHEYYAAPVDLPPGLRKKYYRTGKLPPGWEKRFRPFPPSVIQRLPHAPAYCDRGYVDGYAVAYDRRTRVIVDLIDLVNVAVGR